MFERKETLRKADIIFGILIIATASLFLYLSLTMPIEGLKVKNKAELAYTAPGLVPAVVCVILIVLGIFLIIGALREGARVRKTDFWAVIRWCRSMESRHMWVIIGLFIVYIFVMLGRLPYIVSTFLFLIGFMFYFKATKWWKILIISAVTTAAVALSFGEFMMIPLP